jgi:MFS family permease
MDSALNSLNSFGKFQKISALLVISVGSMVLIPSIAYPFLTMQPKFLCREKFNIFDNFHKCHEEDICRDNIFEFFKDPSTSVNNITYEFNLFCEREYYIALIGSGFFLGGILGSVFLSSLPDKYGREKIYKILLVLNFILHLNILFTQNIFHFIFINFLSGFVSYSMSMCTLILTEYLPRNKSGIIMSMHNSIFPFSGIVIAIYFLYVNNWRVLFMITSAYSGIIAYVVMRYFKESPKWLLSRGRYSECVETLKEIAKINCEEKSFEKFLRENPNFLKNGENEKNGEKFEKTQKNQKIEKFEEKNGN